MVGSRGKELTSVLSNNGNPFFLATVLRNSRSFSFHLPHISFLQALATDREMTLCMARKLHLCTREIGFI